ncbi:MAG: hypothetical protein WCE30_25890 [Mycobacterium sp.]
MEILAFAAAHQAVLADAGGVTTDGFPMTSCHVESFPAQLNLPLVLAVHTATGGEWGPRIYLRAKSPAGERVGFLEMAWEWPDPPGATDKYRVFAPALPLELSAPGVYSIGLYADFRAAEPEFSFPLPFLQA